MEISLWHPFGFLSRYFQMDFASLGPEFPGFSPIHLSWDSNFFKADMYKIPPFESGSLKQDQVRSLFRKKRTHIMAEVPAEATYHIRDLCQAGFSLVETRLHYYHLLHLQPSEKLTSRSAETADIENLKLVAAGAVNEFDRYHSDPFFSGEEASNYLSTYIANCINGFAEIVLVPPFPTFPASFCAVSRIADPCWKENRPLFRIPLTACLPANKGWHFTLCHQALHYAKEQGGAAMLMTTQATNKAVMHNCEKLGFKLGSCTHIFTISNS